MGRWKFEFPSLVELLVVAAIVGTLSCCLWPAVRMVSGFVGDPLARTPPDEANRFHSAAGFSIVVPRDWTVYPHEMLFLAPTDRRQVARRSKALIRMGGLGPGMPARVAGMRQTTFPGGDVAYETMKVERPWSIDDDAKSVYELCFRHGEEWYSLEYLIAEERTTLPDSIRKHLSTFRWDEGKLGPERAKVSLILDAG